MADVTPRFLYNNLVTGAKTITSAHTLNGTANSGYPTSFLRDQLITKAWRSPVGWNIAVGMTQFFNMQETGGASRFSAVIAPGNYPTGAAAATALQTAINAITVPAGGNTYAVTYDTATLKFTITRTAGSLTWGTLSALASVQQSANASYGLGTTTVVGAGPVTGTAVTHSEECLDLDFGSSRSVSAVAIAGHNLSSSAAAYVDHNSAATFAGPNFGTQLTAGTTYTLFQSPASDQYWRIRFNDVTNPSGYTQASIAYLGDYFQPGVSYEYGFTVDRKDYSSVQYADQGASYADIKQTQRVWSLSFPCISYTDYLNFDAMRSTQRVGKDFFFAFDPQNDPTNVVYGFFPEPLRLVNVPAYPTTLWGAGVKFVEALG